MHSGLIGTAHVACACACACACAGACTLAFCVVASVSPTVKKATFETLKISSAMVPTERHWVTATTHCVAASFSFVMFSTPSIAYTSTVRAAGVGIKWRK